MYPRIYPLRLISRALPSRYRTPLGPPPSALSAFSFMSTSTSPAPPTPRPSASLVIINSRNEVLLVHRNPQARSFGGVHVFPGGNLDTAQDASLEVTAIRETFEEAGILLASGPPPSDAVLDTARHAIHAGKTPFQTFLAQNGLQADVDALLPFTQWITPVFAPRRFHTNFYVTFLGATASLTGFSSGAKEDRIPTPDGGQEVIAARFLHPDAVLEEFHAGQITIMPPQFYIVRTLAAILRGGATTAEQRARVEALARGAFGQLAFNPRRLGPPDAKGRVVLTYEGDHTRGGPAGRLHRALVLAGKGGVTSEITLERNFDIFTEIDVDTLSATPSKL
ncbi:NUDIX hydrolase domain-like protein [Mycena rosella]|uniref:NUDIX hydrolase domain-like protein n=1 Tax=Mycena rosella TaxID=1033263 RepID=A0AAD7G9W0_MYCRO|nr:NUDIX hydrolase domain-like protein [Mycena rosella]